MIKFNFSPNYLGIGVSKGIDRGILVNYDDFSLVEEGMGIGSPAIKSKTRTFFSSKSKLTRIGNNKYKKEFYINSELIWNLFKNISTKSYQYHILTAFLNKLNDFYKIVPSIQKHLLILGILSRNFFQAKSYLINHPIIGKIDFFYEINDETIEITVDYSNIIKNNYKNFTKICILNELGGNYFSSILKKNKLYPAPSGWIKISNNSNTQFFSMNYNLTFSTYVTQNINEIKYDLIIGREKISNFCWAGFDIEIDIKSIKKYEKDFIFRYNCSFKSLR